MFIIYRGEKTVLTVSLGGEEGIDQRKAHTPGTKQSAAFSQPKSPVFGQREKVM